MILKELLTKHFRGMGELDIAFHPKMNVLVGPNGSGKSAILDCLALMSCQRELQRREPRHCGTLKGDWYEKKLMVSPLEEDCEERFRFTAYGDISPAVDGDRAARTTIGKLGLNIDLLRALRRGAIDGALAGMDDLSPGEIRKLAAGFLQRDSRGEFPECCVAIAHVLRGLAKP